MSKTLFQRFALVENYPLYAMLGVAAGLAMYTPMRHLTIDSELHVDPSKRDNNAVFEDVKKSEYMSGIYAWVYHAYKKM